MPTLVPASRVLCPYLECLGQPRPLCELLQLMPRLLVERPASVLLLHVLLHLLLSRHLRFGCTRSTSSGGGHAQCRPTVLVLGAHDKGRVVEQVLRSDDGESLVSVHDRRPAQPTLEPFMDSCQPWGRHVGPRHTGGVLPKQSCGAH